MALQHPKVVSETHPFNLWYFSYGGYSTPWLLNIKGLYKITNIGNYYESYETVNLTDTIIAFNTFLICFVSFEELWRVNHFMIKIIYS